MLVSSAAPIAQAVAQLHQAAFAKARAACLEGRRYTVK